MTSRFCDTNDVLTLSDGELLSLEEQISRNRKPADLLLLRQWVLEPTTQSERNYVAVCSELQRRGLLEVA